MRGGTLRLWNDGIADISRIPIDKDVIIEYWAKDESSQKDANRGLPAKDLVDAGYTLVNASSALYYYRDQPPPTSCRCRASTACTESGR